MERLCKLLDRLHISEYELRTALAAIILTGLGVIILMAINLLKS